MMELQILLVVGILAAITILYKVLPYRQAGEKKPIIALLPKYKIQVQNNLNDDQIQTILSDLGFKRTQHSSTQSKFSRGSIIGDISIKLAKINIILSKISDNQQEITIEAAWVAAFDTGDHWQFITELAEKLEQAQLP